LEVEGKVREFLISPDDADQRLDQYVSDSLDALSRSHVQKLIKSGQIKVNDSLSKAGYKIRKDDKITVVIPPPEKLDRVEPEKIPLDILYEDDDLIVINKPAGMVVHPAAGNNSGTLVNALLYHCERLSGIGGVQRPGIVHRLDKDTSGVLVVAKSDRAHQSLSKQIKDRSATRKYLALVLGNVRQDEGTIEARMGRHPVHRKKMSVIKEEHLKSREAVTRYRVKERFNDYTLVEAELKTGRTHQIRVHMSSIKHPVVGDHVYGRSKNEFGVKRQLLHAETLGFIHPANGKEMRFTSDLPDDFKQALRILRGS